MWMYPGPAQQQGRSYGRGCVAVVTGASRGLGRELTLELLRRQVSVIAVARTAETLDAMRGEALAQSSGSAMYIPCPADITTEQGVWRVEACLAQSGLVLMALINNAGMLEPVAPVARVQHPWDPAATSALADWRKHFELNLFAPMELSRRLLPTLRATNGRIINISSGAASYPYHGWGAYCTSKAALDMLTATIAAEEPSVTTVSVSPGAIDTDMQTYIREKARDVMRADEFEKFENMYLEGKLLHPSTPAFVIARIALEAPRSMSGHVYKWDDPTLARFRSHQDAMFSPVMEVVPAPAPDEAAFPPEMMFDDYQ
ncbi:hypothetical protein H4R21_002072 [Coemansia helicoidea]|uniref:Uncharacterized protein n=1 Tax=Coemansia helicoidea TaxID=1286919 RepID=A0ACC1L974_9FUNG|nr:hypothetical protein H4R21_002072 [Coemansia helicoidea]